MLGRIDMFISFYLEVRIGREVALHALVALVLGRRLGLKSLQVSNPHCYLFIVLYLQLFCSSQYSSAKVNHKHCCQNHFTCLLRNWLMLAMAAVAMSP